MIVDFHIPITRTHVSEAVQEFDKEYAYQDLTAERALEFLIAHVFNLNEYSEADSIINCMDTSHKRILLESFKDVYKEYIVDALDNYLKT